MKQRITSNLVARELEDLNPELNFDEPISLKKLTRQAVPISSAGVILNVLQNHNWNRKWAARALSICYRALLYKIREAGLPPNRSSRKPPEEVVNPQVWKWWLVAKLEVRANNFMRSDFGNAILVSNVLSAVTTF